MRNGEVYHLFKRSTLNVNDSYSSESQRKNPISHPVSLPSQEELIVIYSEVEFPRLSRCRKNGAEVLEINKKEGREEKPKRTITYIETLCITSEQSNSSTANLEVWQMVDPTMFKNTDRQRLPVFRKITGD